MVLMEYFHRGWYIFYVEENGRRFYSTKNPKEGSWAIAQEFCSLDSAHDYINDRLDRKED